jgi:hypothetical protein
MIGVSHFNNDSTAAPPPSRKSDLPAAGSDFERSNASIYSMTDTAGRLAKLDSRPA